MRNKVAGKAAEDAFEARLKAEGKKYVAHPKGVKTEHGYRFYDFAILDDSGKIIKYIEVKSGSATRSVKQRLKDLEVGKKIPVEEVRM